MGSVLETRHLSRCNKSSFLLLSSAALCCVRRWQGSPNCFLSARAPPPSLCGRKKRRAISFDGMEPEGAVQPSTFKREFEGESVQLDEASSKVSGKREGRFLLYWITTTSISTSTSFTITYSVSSALCTPAGGTQCG